jgi:hypothetical protein
LLRTTFTDLFTDHTQRSFAVVSASFGPDSAQARAIQEAPFACLGCFTLYPASVILLRRLRQTGSAIGGVTSTRGGAARAAAMLTMTACRDCGGAEALWIYDPHRRER